MAMGKRMQAAAVLVLAWVGVVCASGTEGDPPKAIVEPVAGHLEGPKDAHMPTPPQPKFAGRAAAVSRDGYVSVQVNVDAAGANILGDAANEPSIAVDPTNPTRMAIGWRQFDNISSDFRQAGWGYTTDGGYSWTFPGAIDAGVFRSDPVLDSDADGNFFYNSLTADDGRPTSAATSTSRPMGG